MEVFDDAFALAQFLLVRLLHFVKLFLCIDALLLNLAFLGFVLLEKCCVILCSDLILVCED